MSHYEFFINVVPVGKGRPKFARRGKFVSTYTPAKTRQAEQTIGFALSLIIPKLGMHSLLMGPLECEIICYIPRCKSVTKRTYPTTKPDLDNYAKTVFDSMNGLIYYDDSQIINAICRKRYASDTQPVGIFIRIEELLSQEQNEGKKCKKITGN